MRALNAIAIDPATRIPDVRITADRRFSLALGVAVPLSLQGRPSRPARLLEVDRRLLLASREQVSAGPAGRALEAARLIAAAAGAPCGAEAALLARRSIDLAIDAEVLAACGQDRSLVDARARAEQRALDICTPSRRTWRRPSWPNTSAPGSASVDAWTSPCSLSSPDECWRTAQAPTGRSLP